MSHQNSKVASFESISPAEFFYRNRQMAGFGNPTQAVYSTVRELVENSLDSCEDAQKQPCVEIEIQNDTSDTISVTVSDNGIGVPSDQIPNAFGRVLYGSKYSQRQKRGTFGLGVTMAVLYGQITTDSPILVHSRTEGSSGVQYRLLVDVENNQPVVEDCTQLPRIEEGTTVTVTLKGDLKRSQERIIDYLRLTTICTPHAKINLNIDDEVAEVFGGYSESLPSPVRVSHPHPRAADIELLRKMIKRDAKKTLHNFLCDSFQKIGPRTSTKFLRFMNLDPAQIVGEIEREDLARLGNSLRDYDGFEKPDSKCLSPIGKHEFIQSVASLFNTSSTHYSMRGPSEWQGNPFVIEAVLATGDDFSRSDTPTLYRFANRVPLLYDLSDDILMRVMKKTRWARYNVHTAAPVAVFVHICSTRIPFKAAGKQSIASVPEIEKEAHLLFKDLGRKLSKITTNVQRSAREAKKMREFTKSFRHIVRFSASLAERENVPSTEELVRKLFEVDSDA
ncbi:MAG: DNA topoisomerase VI subunit B [Candidatus Thorarchaeota archaeon]|jgi:DNA topoisomerase-6 subunit B